MSRIAKLADIWIGRWAIGRQSVEEARAAVAHMKPIAVVTGASRGIGAALAYRWAEGGHDILLVGRDDEALAANARTIQTKTGRAALTLACDITEPDAPRHIERHLGAQGFYVDVLLNNAGMGAAGPFSETSADDLDRLLATNVVATTRLMHHVLAPMLARARGGILNVASLGGAVPGPNQAAYYASKAHLISLTEAVAAEVSGRGVRVTVLAPGPVDTGFHAAMGAERSPYRLLLPALSTEHVARAAWRGYGCGRRLIIPGVLNRITYLAVRFLPHNVTVPIVKWLLSKPAPSGGTTGRPNA